MQVIHNLGILSIKKDVNENAGFLLANKKGSYCSFFCKPNSRYYGFFYFDNKSMKMYKFIEDIEIAGHNNIDYVKNGFYFAERKKGEVIENFTMPKGFNSIIYELNSENEIGVVLDCKESYDNREWGRNYEISEEKGCIVVKFTKKTDSKEDSSHGKGELSLYLAIKGDNNFFEKNDKWVERHYSHDEERNSQPFRRHVYNALRIYGSKFVFTVSKSRSSGIEDCYRVFDSISGLKDTERENFMGLIKNENVKKIVTNQKISADIKIAYVNALNSLKKLTFKDSDVFAGLPWFFQFWSRDTLVSLKALSRLNQRMAEDILFDYLSKIDSEGRLPDIVNKENKLGSADSHGWLFFRLNDFIHRIHGHKKTINSIKDSLKSIDKFKNKNSKVSDYLKKCSSIIDKKESK